jgi:hypothetical protein
MKYLKLEAIIKIDENLYSLSTKEDIKFFVETLNDKDNTTLQLWSNDIGDEICSTNEFKWIILSELINNKNI